MAVTNVSYELIISTDLRDSGGHSTKIVKLNSFTGTYETGGIVLQPEWFGFTNLVSIVTQPTSAYPLSGAGEPWTLIGFNHVIKVDQGIANGGSANGISEWRIIPFITNGTTFEELADGQSLTFPDGIEPVVIVIGA
jgi:hypothetical protein